MIVEQDLHDDALIAAGRFALRPMRQSDTGLIEMYAGDARVARMTRDIPHPLPPGTVETLLRTATDPDHSVDVWVIDGSAMDHAEVLGILKLERMDRQQSEIRYWVAPAFWNTGIATESVDALITANPHGAAHVFAEVFQDNPGSARVLTNVGFDYLGDAEAFCVARGAIVPTWTYSRKLDG
ncbi:MAG: GNAT family N-acetyltransferase [Alphaproteobacteria bacterium]|jgi:RimJ/RimL family protein N-acetyltransferase|nr:GNAT family N-acetyltransferase [Alphaproteobacteria bacterium]